MAGLFDFSGFGLGNGNWFTWQGQPSPGQPGQPMQLTGTQSPVGTTPTGTPAYSPEMVANARYSMLAQAGMQLMAAGQPMSGAQRAQYLSQLGQLPAHYQESLAQQLEMAQKQKAYQQQQQSQAYLSNMSTEDLVKAGFTPEQATIFKGMGAPADIMERKAFAQPGDPNTQVVDQGDHQELIDKRTGALIRNLGPKAITPDPSQALQQKGQQFTQEQKLNENYVKAAKPFTDTATAYQNMQAAAQISDPRYKPQSDTAMVYSFMKMLDPNSTVREGEAATVAKAGGVPTEIFNLYNYVVGGGALTEDQRAGILAQADQKFQGQAQNYAQTRQQYQQQAQSYGLDPERVAPDLSMGVKLQQRPQAPPTVGQIVNGYRYKGGDPNAQTSWDKVP